MSWTKPTKQEVMNRLEALRMLRALCPPGTSILLVLEHCSQSGMRRSIKAYAKQTEGQLQYLNGMIERAGIARRWKSRGRTMDGSVMDGCGMDMGFALVYELSSRLYPTGFGCIGPHCPSNDHNNGDRNWKPNCVQHTADTCPGRPCSDMCDHKEFTTDTPGSHWHTSGEYALKYQWL